MKMPTDQFGNPAGEPEIHANIVFEFENWCKRYGNLKSEHTALVQFNIGIYQIGQLLPHTKIKKDMIEPVGACFIHLVTALTKLGCSVSQFFPHTFSGYVYCYDSDDLLKAICKTTQQIFYILYARKGSYRRARTNKKELEKYVFQIMTNVGAFISRRKIQYGIEEAAEVLLNEAFKE